MAVQKALEAFAQLNSEERQEFLASLNVAVSLKPWMDVASCDTPGSHPVRMGTLDQAESEATGCPWCRRPVSVSGTVPDAVYRDAGTLEVPGDALHEAENDEAPGVIQPEAEKLPMPSTATALPASEAREGNERLAYVTLVYGNESYAYFLGALVLGWGLRKNRSADCPEVKQILMHTSDVPATYLTTLEKAGWELRQIPYIRYVANKLLYKRGSFVRFNDIFTKLRILELADVDLALFVDSDLLVREAPGDPLSSLFKLRAPAAMMRGRRGYDSYQHGERVPYTDFWTHPDRASSERDLDQKPRHEQVGGINAGVVLFKTDPNMLQIMTRELYDYEHPEHCTTRMPEQEYLGRFYGTFDKWTHIHCRYNFEVRGWLPNSRTGDNVPFDYSKAHEAIQQDGRPGHPGAVVLHYSGTWVKPWDLLFHTRGDPSTLKVRTYAKLPELLDELRGDDPSNFLGNYADLQRLWTSLLEWMEQFVEMANDLHARFEIDVIEQLHDEVASGTGWSKENGWWRSEWYSSQ